MKYSAIVAMAKEGVIGKGNTMPWHLKEDLRHFKKVTMGHPIIMGSKTFHSIGRALPGRKNIVLSRQLHWPDGGDVQVCHSIEEAEQWLEMHGFERAFIIGGAEIYRLFIDRIDQLYITRISLKVDGDTYFPEPNWEHFQLISQESGTGEDPPFLKYTFEAYERRNSI